MKCVKSFRVTGLVPLVAGLGLAGCGGGSTGTPQVVAPTPSPIAAPASGPSIQYFELSNTSPGTSELSGTFLVRRWDVTPVTHHIVQGMVTYDRTTDTFIATIDNFDQADFVDPEGDGIYENSTSVFETSAGFFGGSFSLDFSNNVEFGGTISPDGKGIYGFATAAADIPTTGTVTFRGSHGTDHPLMGIYGRSEIIADFENASVDVVLRSDNVLSSSPFVTVAPYSTLEVQGMTIAGNVFSGGVVKAFDGLGEIDISDIAGTEQLAQGTFFGYDETLDVPAEAGGVLRVEGPSGSITSLFSGQ